MLTSFVNLAFQPNHKLLSTGPSPLGWALSGPHNQAPAPSASQGQVNLAAFKVDSVVAIYETHAEAEQAIRRLQAGGVNMRTLSIAAKNTHMEEHVAGFYNSGNRMMYWGKVGAFWGAMWGLLFDSALFAIPGIGPVLLAGPLVSWVVAVLEGAVVFGGVGALGAALLSIGVPNNSVLQYETAIKTDKLLVIVHGMPEAISKAKDLIDRTNHLYYTVHGEKVFAR